LTGAVHKPDRFESVVLETLQAVLTGDVGVEASKAREFRPDVVLLDIGLPDINGYEVTAGAATHMS
jgi:DNA-binding response OmpR family regulator